MWSERVVSEGPFALLLRNGARRPGSLVLRGGQSPGAQLSAPLPALPQEGGAMGSRSSSSLTCSIGPDVCAGQGSGQAMEGTEGDVSLPLSSYFISSIHAFSHNC